MDLERCGGFSAGPFVFFVRFVLKYLWSGSSVLCWLPA